MINDAVNIFAKTLIQNETFMSDFKINPTDCYKYDENQEPNPNGRAILDTINNVIDIR